MARIQKTAGLLVFLFCFSTQYNLILYLRTLRSQQSPSWPLLIAMHIVSGFLWYQCLVGSVLFDAFYKPLPTPRRSSCQTYEILVVISHWMRSICCATYLVHACRTFTYASPPVTSHMSSRIFFYRGLRCMWFYVLCIQPVHPLKILRFASMTACNGTRPPFGQHCTSFKNYRSCVQSLYRVLPRIPWHIWVASRA
ncbi:uncharacterized protein EDB91DRAFT_173703 [Suillus paluster]|uniref:uncharacterized protein n=1 Tax=Suillus paluster TaxID=48578 RepID=UPI001B8842C0|nr:uncharacterized protein EDB91DRAFT_173703 [Suillus paluster]KAG1745073.1 hypothetical protein EDB91DRAFT_173703 [Suillus paluster]